MARLKNFDIPGLDLINDSDPSPQTEVAIYEDDGRIVHEPVTRPRLKLRRRPLRLRYRESKRSQRRSKRKGASEWCPGDPVPESAYTRFSRAVFTSDAYMRLSHPAKVLLVGLLIQYNGHNRRKLVATLPWAARYCGFGSSSAKTLARCIAELINAGFIELVREHSRATPALYTPTCLVPDANETH